MLGQVMRVAKDQEANEARSQATSDTLLNTMGLNPSIKPTPEKEPSKPLPPNCPPWAARLKDVEVSKLSSMGKRYWYVEVYIYIGICHTNGLVFHRQLVNMIWVPFWLKNPQIKSLVPDIPHKKKFLK